MFVKLDKMTEQLFFFSFGAVVKFIHNYEYNNTFIGFALFLIHLVY